MTNVEVLMRLHVEALFTCDGAGRLVAVNDPGGAAAPRFFLGRTARGNLWWFRNDVGAALASDLNALCESLPAHPDVEAGPGSTDAFISRLSREEPIRKTWAGPAFGFPTERSGHHSAVRVTSDNRKVLGPYLDEWRSDVAAGVPMVVVLEGGSAVSVCCSVRVTARAHEAGVETHPGFRGRGYAARAVSAWASIVHEMDRIPLYSTSWGNMASRALARRLALIQYGTDLHIT